MKKASRVKRLIANIIDFILVGCIVFLIVFVTIQNIIYLFSGDNISFANVIVFFDFIRWLVVSFIFVIGYYVLIPTLLRGQTIGMKLLRIKIVDLEGNPPSFTRMFIREIVGRLLFDFTSAGVTMVVSLFLAFRKNRLTLHDTLAETQVVEKED